MTQLFFVKFGEKKYLEKLRGGKVYFSTAKRIREIENIQLNKGQGDKAEGKFVVHVIKAELKDPVTHNLIAVRKDIDVIIDYEQIEAMPVFCLMAINDIDCKKIGIENKYKIALNSQKERDIRKSFEKADAALIIKNPEYFIDDIKNSFEGNCYANMVNYYDISYHLKKQG